MRIFVIVFFLFLGELQAAELTIVDKASFDVKIARSDEELKKGLMFVKELPEFSGMLFDFRRFEGQGVAMWMKNTYIPLDMLFLDCDMKLVGVYENAEPLSLTRIESKRNFCYVVEINGGKARELRLSVGDKAVLRTKK
ncbi:MAG: DUF192 domain-containing protein [Alphaproteobacteria bacterium]|nr:DUF192 domain-containing protein [Alphaproteobacteria bacterium]